jgi:zinc D-Ala-D-Ala carboxypeptidase
MDTVSAKGYFGKMMAPGRLRMIILVGAAFSLSAACAEERPRRDAPPSPPAPAGGQAGATIDPAALSASLPPEIRRGILARPDALIADVQAVMAEAGRPFDRAGTLTRPESLVVLVDKKHALPAAWEPADLVGLDGLGVKTGRRGLSLRRPAARALAEMSQAARAAGVELVASSTYRSFAYQKEVWERNVRQLGVAGASRESARPGESQHQLGTAVDFGSIDDSFAASPASRWLAVNAGRYGFSLSYPAGLEELTGYRHESWHWRYIGRAAARLEREFFGGVQQYMLEFLLAYPDQPSRR